MTIDTSSQPQRIKGLTDWDNYGAYGISGPLSWTGTAGSLLSKARDHIRNSHVLERTKDALRLLIRRTPPPKFTNRDKIVEMAIFLILAQKITQIKINIAL